MKIFLEAITDQETQYIRMFYRRFDAKQGEIHDGHTHDNDHVTILWTGSIKVIFKYPDGKFHEKLFNAPCHFWVNKTIEHEITALEDGTSWGCFFLPPEGFEEDLKPFWNETSLYDD